MGNCLFGELGEGQGEEDEFSIKVIKSDGGVIEFYSPVSDKFSGHSVFSSLWRPLPHHHLLVPGQAYYLLPNNKLIKTECHVRSNSKSFPAITPYRMSLDYNVHSVLKRSYTDVFSRTRQKEKKTRTRRRRRPSSNKGGMWKVKLVINTEDLLQILSEDGRTSDLIENVRAVAKRQNVSIPSDSSENNLSIVHV